MAMTKHGPARFMLPAIGFCWLAASALAQERDEQPGGPGDRYTLSAAHQGNRLVAWRLDRLDGRVSVCLRLGATDLTCSAWSTAASPEDGGPFAINAENSSPVQNLWVWRIDAQSGRLAYCSVPCCQDLEAAQPTCLASPH